jgi:hypothetical protein
VALAGDFPYGAGYVVLGYEPELCRFPATPLARPYKSADDACMLFVVQKEVVCFNGILIHQIKFA